MPRRVFVTGFFDLLNSGHVSFLRDASQFGNLYVGVGSDRTFRELRQRQSVYSEQERLYMVKSLRYVKDAFINTGNGVIDYVGILDRVKPDVFVVNEDGDNQLKRRICDERGIQYVVLGTRTGADSFMDKGSHLPYRIDIAGTWIDQPYVSVHGPGWAITASIEPTFDFMERGGMSTSTRNAARKIWPYELPAYDEEMLARMLFCLENHPDKEGHVSGAQDAIGICISGLSRHYYDGHYWPARI